MAETLFFLHADPCAAASIAAPLASKGYAIEISTPDEPNVRETIADARPVALVVSLDHDPRGAREVAAGAIAEMHDDPMLVFVGGSDADVEATRDAVPSGRFVANDEIATGFAHLTSEDLPATV